MSSDSDTDNHVLSTPAVQTYTHPYQSTHKRSCHYCYGMIADGREFHDECKGDFEWEQKMRVFNAHWRPVVDLDYSECI